jgi:hypothetical protein
LRDRLVREWTAGKDAWSPEAMAIFGELGLDEDASRKRPLVESATFRALADGTTPEELPQAA